MHIAFYGDSLTKGLPGVSFVSILQDMFPEHHLANCGKGGDTVISLYRRILEDGACAPTTIALLWVGVNDVFARITRAHSMLKRVMRQPWAKDHTEFRTYCRRILPHLLGTASHVLLSHRS